MQWAKKPSHATVPLKRLGVKLSPTWLERGGEGAEFQSNRRTRTRLPEDLRSFATRSWVSPRGVTLYNELPSEWGRGEKKQLVLYSLTWTTCFHWIWTMILTLRERNTANNIGFMYSRKRISQNLFPNFIYIFPKSIMKTRFEPRLTRMSSWKNIKHHILDLNSGLLHHN